MLNDTANTAVQSIAVGIREATRLKVLAVDDSALYRRFVCDALSDCPNTEVVGQASNGLIALQQIEALQPDAVILDIHMPVLDGIDVLQELHRQDHPPAVIVLTSDAAMAVMQTTRALALGAFDFVLKPRGINSDAELASELRRRIDAIASSKVNSPIANTNSCGSSSPQRPPSCPPEVVAIGVSTGGPVALAKLLSKIPSNFPVPILVVQHMPKAFTPALAEHLDELCPLFVRHSSDEEVIASGNVYVAPGGKQMRVENIDGQRVIRVLDAPALNNCRPSVDYLLRSVAVAYGDASLALIMTGMGNDGTEGCRLIREKRGTVLTQDANSCVVYGMARSVVDAGLSSESCALDDIAGKLTEYVEIGGLHAHTGGR